LAKAAFACVRAKKSTCLSTTLKLCGKTKIYLAHRKYWQNAREFKKPTEKHYTGLWSWFNSFNVGTSLFLTAAIVTAYHKSQDTSSDVNKSSATPLDNLPVEHAMTTFAPQVPPPIQRDHPARVVVNMKTSLKTLPIDETNTYEFWAFDEHVPGPMIRARVGDTLEVHFKNEDETGMFHNIDFHAVLGPGGGSPLLTAEKDQTKTASFRLLYPGLFFYHCSVDPIAVHVGNGMYGMILVEPENGLPPVDKEFYVLQSEVYATEDPLDPKSRTLVLSYENLVDETPRYVVLNGRARKHVEEPLEATTKDRIRIFFCNAGPNLLASFHVIGTIFDKVYREGNMTDAPSNGVHVTAVPAGGTACVEFDVPVSGTYTILDHSLSRVEKGCVGFINVCGDSALDIYHSDEPPTPCPSCSTHP